MLFLTLDHTNNDGKRHRRSIGFNFYCWLVKNNFPTDPPMSVLCMNCNFGRSHNRGVCPHKGVS